MRWPIVSLCAAMVVGCAQTPSAPIENRTGYPPLGTVASGNSAGKTADTYRVKKGDTLFAIAFSLNLPMEQLAAINGLKPPYGIYPGQVLQTALNPSTLGGQAAGNRLPATVTVQHGDTLYGIAKILGVSMQSLIDINELSAPYRLSVGQILRTPTATQAEAVASTQKAANAVRSQAKKSSEVAAGKASSRSTSVVSGSKTSRAGLGPVSRWRWPSDGRLVRGYSTNLHKGVDIAGKRGDPVRAAARGVVVYAGTGVKGYGALIIVKHNDDYLSAYGHNDAILVAEGDTVKDAAVIARMGSSGTDSVKLHFEIRRQGKPIDPVKVLPRR